MYDEGFSPKLLMLHLTRFEQLMNESDLGNKVSLLGACINFDFGYVNVYKFGLHGVHSWIGLIRGVGILFL